MLVHRRDRLNVHLVNVGEAMAVTTKDYKECQQKRLTHVSEEK